MVLNLDNQQRFTKKYLLTKKVIKKITQKPTYKFVLFQFFFILGGFLGFFLSSPGPDRNKD